MATDLLKRLSQLMIDKVPEKTDYRISGADGERIGGNGDFYNLVYRGSWEVYTHERGTIYKKQKCKDERDACIQFLKMTDDEYHLAKYISEFKEATA